jgi:hypothetical protein
MEGEAKSAETPEAFLNALGDSLKGKDGADTDLVEILVAHILKAAPAKNAVANAKDAILKLAVERANPSKQGAANG